MRERDRDRDRDTKRERIDSERVTGTDRQAQRDSEKRNE